MSLSPIYLKWEEETLQRGIQQGEARGREQVWSQAIPVLLELGLTIEQVAERLQIDIDTVQRLSQTNENPS